MSRFSVLYPIAITISAVAFLATKQRQLNLALPQANCGVPSIEETSTAQKLVQLRPKSPHFIRVDENFLVQQALFMTRNHVLHDTLKGPGLIEIYEVYRKLGESEIVCLIKLGERLNGYPNIVHGGITALLFDNTFGWVFLALDAPPAVTANLTVNYKKPVRAGSWLLLTARLDKLEGRKLQMSANMTDESGNVLAECSTLFIAPKQTAQETVVRLALIQMEEASNPPK